MTLDRLQMRGLSLRNGCYMCKREEDSVDHILFHYARTKILWQLVFSLFGISLGDPFFKKTDFIQFSWVFCWEELEKSVDNCPFVFILDYLEGNKLEDI